MDQIICPKCKCEYGYFDGNINICPECAFEWDDKYTEEKVYKDVNGNILQDGDTVVVVKDLKVRGGGSTVIKQGTKVKNIKLTDEGDHDINCKIDGFGSMQLKTSVVKKA